MRASRRRAAARPPKVISHERAVASRHPRFLRSRGAADAFLRCWRSPACSARATPARRRSPASCATPASINFVTTGGALRNSATQHLPARTRPAPRRSRAFPAGTTIRNAYLYWGGQAPPPPPRHQRHAERQTVTASRTFARTCDQRHANHPFFGDFANVTSLVTAPPATALHLRQSHGDHRRAALRRQHRGRRLGAHRDLRERHRAAARHQRIRRPRLFLRQPAHADVRMAFAFRPPTSTAASRCSRSKVTRQLDRAQRLRRSAALQRQPARRRPGVRRQRSDRPAVRRHHQHRRHRDRATASTSTSTTSAVSSVPAQTSGTTVYSAGADLVLLMAQIVSATSDPAVDLGVTMTHTGNFVAGEHRPVHHHGVQRGGHGARGQHRHRDRHAARGLLVQRGHWHGLELQRRGTGGHLHACADTQFRRFLPGSHADRQRARDRGGQRQSHGHGDHAEFRLQHGQQLRHRCHGTWSFPNLSTSTKTRGRSQWRRSAARRHAALHDHADRVRRSRRAPACRSPITSRQMPPSPASFRFPQARPARSRRRPAATTTRA